MAADPVVARHVVEVIGKIGERVRPEHRPGLAAHARALLATVEVTTSFACDLEPVRTAARTTLPMLGAADGAAVGPAAHRVDGDLPRP